MHILNIGTPITNNQNHKVANTDFLDGTTFLDAELIFWDVSSCISKFPGIPSRINFNEKENLVKSMKRQLQKRKKELDEFFQLGRTLIITNPNFQKYEYQYQNSDKVISLDYNECIDINPPVLESIKGRNMHSTNLDVVKMFVDSNKERLYYSSKIISPKGIPLLFIKDTKYVISEYYNIDNGLIIIIPDFNYKSNPPIENQTFLDSIIKLINGLMSLIE